MKHTFLKVLMMRPGLLIPVFFLCISSQVEGQLNSSSVWQTGEQLISTLPVNAHLLASNPAANALQDADIYCVSHSMPFLLNDLGISGMDILIPVFPGAFDFGLQGYGLPGYFCFNSTTGYGLRIMEDVSAGVRFNYIQHLSGADRNLFWQIGISGGFIYELSDILLLAMYLENPLLIQHQNFVNSPSNSMIHLGLSYEFYEDTKIFIETGNSFHDFYTWKALLSYTGISSVQLLLAWCNEPASLTFGSSIALNNFSIVPCFTWKGILGFTPSLTLVYTPAR